MKDSTVEVNNVKSISNIVMIGMCTAIIATLSQISISLPSGVPITLQTFAIALTGYLLGRKAGAISAIIYMLLGMVGVPVFSRFQAGIPYLLGKTGGFIFGFIPMAFLCGLAIEQKSKIKFVSLCIFSSLGLAACHLLGILQFKLLTHMTFGASALLVSIPYLLKDVLSCVAAYILAKTIKKVL